MQDLPGYRCSFTKGLWDENQETLVACNIHESFLQRSKYSESSFYSRDGFLPGVKIFFCQRKVPQRDLGDRAMAKYGALQLLKATRWHLHCSCSRASPVKLNLQIISGDLCDSTPIYSLHHFILSRFLEQQLSFSRLE